MGLFGRKKDVGWPATTYGYLPPPDADVRSWACPDVLGCNAGEHAPDPKSWPKSCPKCGKTPICSGVVAGRYEHPAKRYEIDYLLQHATDWRLGKAQLDDVVWRYSEEARNGSLQGAAAARQRVEAVLLQRGSVSSDTGTFYVLLHEALRANMLGEALAILQTWLSRVPLSNGNGMERASVRGFIDCAAAYLEHPSAPRDAAFQQLWQDLRGLWSQAKDYTTADNDAAMRRLLQRLEHS